MGVLSFREHFRITIFVVVAVIVVDSHVSYKDVHVFRIDAKNERQLDQVKAVRAAYPTDHMWRVTRSLVHLAYPKQEARRVSAALTKRHLKHKIVTRDLQAVFDKRDMDTASVPERMRRGVGCQCCNETMLSDFHRYDHIVKWLKFLVNCKKTDKALNLKTFDLGTTFEKRPLVGIEIGAPAEGDAPKPVIWLHANEHAREWLAGSTAIYLIDRLVNDEKYKRLAQEIHWLIVPIENPDGYEFTHTKDRLWRKNRNTVYGLHANGTCKGDDCKEKACVGVDLNRNWDSRWDSHVDTSEDPCEYQVYDGPKAFSEVESANARDKIQKHLSNMGAFFSIHTFGQLWLVPYSFSDEKPADFDQIQAVATAGAKKIGAVHQTNWTAGPSPSILYAVSGSGMDWAKLNGVKYSYTLELRPHDDPTNDGSSFVPSKSAIIPAGEEVIVGIEHVADIVIKEWKAKHTKAKKASMADKFLRQDQLRLLWDKSA